MGVSQSNNRRRNHHAWNNSNAYYAYPPPHSFSYSYYSSDPPPYPPPPPPPPPFPFPSQPPHLLPPPSYSSYPTTTCNCSNPLPVVGRSVLVPPYHNNSDWYQLPPQVVGIVTPPTPSSTQQPKKVRSGVNVHKDSLKLERDDLNPHLHLVSFVFDALFDGNITVFYFVKEDTHCRFIPLYPHVHVPITVPFQRGLGQKFRQPSGTGIDLGFFEIEDLSSEENVFPLVITATTCLPSVLTEDQISDKTSLHMQISQAVLEKDHEEGAFKVRIIRQILWVDNVRYELQELYGIGDSGPSYDNNGSGKECVICMTEPKDTAVLPCRHLCMCNGCAKTLTLQSDRCPICRQPFEELLEINIYNVDNE